MLNELKEVVQTVCEVRDILISVFTALLAWYAHCTYHVQKDILKSQKPIPRTSICNLLYSKDVISCDMKKQLPYFVVAICFFLALFTGLIKCFAVLSSVWSILISLIVLRNNNKIAVRLNQESRAGKALDV